MQPQPATPRTALYRVRCAGLEFVTPATSAFAACIAATDLHGVPATFATRVSA